MRESPGNPNHEERSGDGGQRLSRDGGHRNEHRVLGGGREERLETAGKSVRDLRVAEVLRQDVVIENGTVAGYRIRLAISFKYETDA